MFSDKDAIHIVGTPASSLCAYLSSHCQTAANALKVDVLLLATLNDAIIDVPFCHGLNHSTINGAPKTDLLEALNDCAQKYPRPHVHNISNLKISETLVQLAKLSSRPLKAIYVPVISRDVRLICFGAAIAPALSLDPTNTLIIQDLCDHAALLIATDELSKRLRITEFFAKEVGHDIASAVQATIAKLRNVSKGIITGKMAIERIVEAEKEIMSAYRVAESLGITVDANYNIGEGREFDMCDAIRRVISLYKSEADERHIDFKMVLPDEPVTVWGNRPAMESAIGQLLLNAIKYARGSSYITIRVEDEGGDVNVSITDAGLALDESERWLLWKFGERGKRALELHVNGSGIGLYTVKKIIDAHGGRVFSSSGNDASIVTFGFNIPARELLKKPLTI